MSGTRRFDNRHDRNDKMRGIGYEISNLAPTLPASLQSNWAFIQVCHQRACFGYCIEPVSLALSASLVNELLRRIGILISSYAMASDQVPNFEQSFAVQG